ncbi:MAG: allophanate hydrolase [Proteobacteria bacterium]|nr:allophanate hydrolase [Pseudomonadota bacterium]
MTPAAALAADRAHGDAAIWIARVPEGEVLARARELALEGPRGRALWGVPFAVKDNIDVAGLPTTAACPGFSYVPSRSAPAVQRLLDAGAVLLGKTNLDQFATGLVGVRSPYGVPRNVFDAGLVPGGSSSGSGCVVAAGIVPFALGTDTAGSGRVPAAFGNIVGLKPTPGSVSAVGMVPACRSLDTISVFAGTVDAALAVQRVIAGFDPADPYARRPPAAPWRRAALAEGVRIATADVAHLCSDPVAALHLRAARLLRAETVDIAPLLDLARLLYDGPWVAERTAALRGVLARVPDILHPVTRRILQSGFDRRTVDAFVAFDRLAEARRAAEALFAEYDALLLPTVPFCPTLAEVAADPIGPNSRLGTFTNFANLCGLAAFAVPGGIGADGVPVGMTLFGPAWSEGRLAPIADALHRAVAETVGATTQPLPPPAAADGPADGETALFCIGAHMSGLALNARLVARGGRFLRAAATVPGYRLHALGDRPGLVRASEGGGSIAGEVWVLPTAAIGAVLAEVPPPLGFGTVVLAEGPCLGFLAEAAGVAGAPDITQFGDWRAWVRAGGGLS